MTARITRLLFALVATLLVMAVAPAGARAAGLGDSGIAPATAAAQSAPHATIRRAATTRARHAHRPHRYRLHHQRRGSSEPPASHHGALAAAAATGAPSGPCYAPGDPDWCRDLAAAEVGLASAIQRALVAGVPVATLARDAPAWQRARLRAAARSHEALLSAYIERTHFVADAASTATRSGMRAQLS